jgi:hypothetical protein
MTSITWLGVSWNRGIAGWIPSSKGRCKSATGYLRRKCAKWGRIRKATSAGFADGVTLRAILADEYQTSSFRWRFFCESGFSYTQQECAPGKK